MYPVGTILVERSVHYSRSFTILVAEDDTGEFSNGQPSTIVYDPFHIYGRVKRTAISSNEIWSYEVITEEEATMLKLEGA